MLIADGIGVRFSSSEIKFLWKQTHSATYHKISHSFDFPHQNIDTKKVTHTHTHIIKIESIHLEPYETERIPLCFCSVRVSIIFVVFILSSVPYLPLSITYLQQCGEPFRKSIITTGKFSELQETNKNGNHLKHFAFTNPFDGNYYIYLMHETIE